MGLMDGRRAFVMGVANDHSIAWGIAKALASEGCELAFSYQGEAFGKRVRPLAESLGATTLLDVNVTDDASLDAAFETLEAGGPLDASVVLREAGDEALQLEIAAPASLDRPGPSAQRRQIVTPVLQAIEELGPKPRQHGGVRAREFSQDLAHERGGLLHVGLYGLGEVVAE